MGKPTTKSRYANKRQREENLKQHAGFVAKQWEQIRVSREQAEEARQKRADRLGRDATPMPGYRSYVRTLDLAA